MFGATIDNETTKKYVAAFGSMFNDFKIYRRDNSGTIVQTVPIPLHFAPFQKFLSRLKQDPEFKAPSMSLPRMSFEIVGINYDSTRKLGSSLQMKAPYAASNDTVHSVFAATPYNFEFQLNVMVKNYEDGTKIIEQILPYFTPHFTMSMYLIDGYDPMDVSVILQSTSPEDTYEGSYEEERIITWTLNFTLQGWFFGPVVDKKVIKFVETHLYDDTTDATVPSANVYVQPGLTANGQPTTDYANTVPYTNINYLDDWDYIVRIEENI